MGPTPRVLGHESATEFEMVDESATLTQLPWSRRILATHQVLHVIVFIDMCQEESSSSGWQIVGIPIASCCLVDRSEGFM